MRVATCNYKLCSTTRIFTHYELNKQEFLNISNTSTAKIKLDFLTFYTSHITFVIKSNPTQNTSFNNIHYVGILLCFIVN